MSPCKHWWGTKHLWHKALYSEWKRSNDFGYQGKIYHDAQLYGTKQCERCGIWGEGFAERDHPRMREALSQLNNE